MVVPAAISTHVLAALLTALWLWWRHRSHRLHAPAGRAYAYNVARHLDIAKAGAFRLTAAAT